MLLVEWRSGYLERAVKAAVSQPDDLFSICSALDSADDVLVFTFPDEQYHIAPWASRPEMTFLKFLPESPRSLWDEMGVYDGDSRVVKENLTEYKRKLHEENIQKQKAAFLEIGNKEKP